MRKNWLVILFLSIVVSGCAGPNPNAGERTADNAWLSGRVDRAFEIVKPKAEAGEPWAQLRLGMFYENGWGTEENIPAAVKWYKKAAAQKGTGDWAEGKIVGAAGKSGYFNQNSDARIAQRNLANIYLKGQGIEKDLVQAYLNIRTVKDEIKGRDIFFCCEFAGGRVFPAKDVDDIYEAVLKEMSEKQKADAEARYAANS